MGVLIKWRSIDAEATYNYARVYRSSTRDSGYVVIATQSMTDQSYYDADGTLNHWYKVDFYVSTTQQSSQLSDAMRGGTVKGYCTVQDVRNMTNISITDLTDTQVCNLIEYAGSQLNADIQVYHEEERIRFINDVKNNEIASTNTTFWTRVYPIGDLNGDMAVDTTDLIVYEYLGNGTRTQHTISSVVPNTGQFILSIAPTYPTTVTYKSASLSVSDPDPLVRMACALLSAAWAYTKINVGKSPRWRMGSTQIWRDMDSFKTYYNKYQSIVNQINQRVIMDGIIGRGMPEPPLAFFGGYVPGDGPTNGISK